MDKTLEDKHAPANKNGSESALKRADRFLDAHYRDGSWPYTPGQGPSTETTAWCMLHTDKEDISRLQASVNFLKTNQNRDGGWSTGLKDDESDWCTGLALFAVRSVAGNLSDDGLKNCINRGFEYLSQHRGEVMNMYAQLAVGLWDKDQYENYALGWPWSPGAYHWVEPTSYNLFAFKIPGLFDQSKGATVVRRANRFLVENACSIGGWNHGSHHCLGVDLPPYIVTTAEALLALQDLPEHKEVTRGLDFLSAHSEASTAGQTKSAMALAWTALAFHSYDRDAKPTLAHLIDLQNEDGSFGPNIMVTALSAMALNTEHEINPFKFSWKNPETVPSSKS